FSPRLADAGASVFWRMDHDADYGVLNDIARGQSDPRKIVLQWDEMIRTAGSLKLGKVQVSVLVRSLLKSERPSGLTQAIIEVGRINKTLYLLNYIDDEDGTVAKLAMRQPFVLFKGLTFQKLCLPGAFRPGDHHNNM
ncbi:Tn3 family transposase, partial [Escherichia coli]|uniref:Tn3 family transposase n=1 Tax=Escherichia coli TaxID=562 RepID=UPI000B250D7E